MIEIALTVFAVFSMLVITERYHKQKKINGETARKLVHIGVASFAATWPFYLNITEIEVLSLLFVAGVLVVRYSRLFGSIHDVERKTWGDILFPLGIGLSAVVASEPWIFSAAVLHMGLADGAAALVGTRYKKAHFYKVLGQRKSIVGTASFLLISIMITATVVLTQQQALGHVAVPLLLWLPLLVTALENIAPSGTDNLIIPFVVSALLNAVVLQG